MALNAAHDTIIRFALGMLAIAPDSPCTAEQRAWITHRLESTAALTDQERAKLRQPLLEWYARLYPRSYAIVAAQFEKGGSCPAEETATAQSPCHESLRRSNPFMPYERR